MSNKFLTVRAPTGATCPREGVRGRFITDVEAVTVPSSAYYRRRIANGELLLVAAAATPAPASRAAKSNPPSHSAE